MSEERAEWAWEIRREMQEEGGQVWDDEPDTQRSPAPRMTQPPQARETLPSPTWDDIDPVTERWERNLRIMARDGKA